MKRMIEVYNNQIGKDEINNDPKCISWTRGLKKRLIKNEKLDLEAESIKIAIYRPFCKQWLYFSRKFNEYLYKMPIFFPNNLVENQIICITGIGANKDFNCYIVNHVPDVQLQSNNLCLPLYTYEKQSELGSLFATANTEQYTKKENIPDSILKEYQQKYEDKTITKEDIFYYIYGVLHSPEYKQRFASDLKKMLPRIPFTADFWTFSQAGRELAYWHINYETIEPYELEEFKKDLYLDSQDYQVEKMVFGKNKNGLDKTIIIYNSKLTLSQIPLEAYEYIVNGKSALEWIMERYKVTKDKDSGIINDPNHWSENPRYIVDLVKRIVRVSLETVRIVNSLPALNEW